MERTEKIKVHDWEIDPDGTMLHERPYYCIEGGCLDQGNWIMHMFRKNWVNPYDFVDAFFHACRVRGLDKVTLDPKMTL